MSIHHSTVSIAGLVLLALLMPAPAQSVHFPTDQGKDKWAGDLDYLVEYLEAAHPNLYRNVPHKTVADAVISLRARLPELNEPDIIIEYMKLMALFRDGHTTLWFQPKMRNLFHGFPVRFYQFADGLYILAIDRQHGQYAGMKVVTLGNVPAAEAVLRVSRAISADNPWGKKRHYHMYLFNAEILRHFGIIDSVERLDMVLEDSLGNTHALSLTAEPALGAMLKVMRGMVPVSGNATATMNESAGEPLPLYLKNGWQDNYWFEVLNEHSAMYLQINRMSHNDTENFESFCDRLFNTFDQEKLTRLIIDVRLNEGGSNSLADPLLRGILGHPALDHPSNLFLITGRSTFSAAEHLVSVLEKYTRVTIVGEPTGAKPNHDGSVKKFALPHSGMEISYSTCHFVDTDPVDYRLTTRPDFFVELTGADYRTNHDPVIALILDPGFKPLPGMLRELQTSYISGGLDSALARYDELKPVFDARNGHTRQAVDLFAYWLFEDKNDHTGALQFFRLNIDAYPDSFIGYNSLGECYLADDDLYNAKIWFRKALALYPGHGIVVRNLTLAELRGR